MATGRRPELLGLCQVGFCIVAIARLCSSVSQPYVSTWRPTTARDPGWCRINVVIYGFVTSTSGSTMLSSKPYSYESNMNQQSLVFLGMRLQSTSGSDRSTHCSSVVSLSQDQESILTALAMLFREFKTNLPHHLSVQALDSHTQKHARESSTWS